MDTRIISAVILGLVFAVDSVLGQIAPYGFYSGGLVQQAQGDPADSIVQLAADAQGLSLADPSEIPIGGTFWTITPDSGQALPYPCLVPGQSLPTYALPNGTYLVDDSFTTNTVTQAVMEAQATTVVGLAAEANAAAGVAKPHFLAHTGGSFPGPGGSGSGTNTYSPDIFTNTINYGTNLFIAQLHISSGYLDAIASNTITDVEYEVQSSTNLNQATNWVSRGFIMGSETTNWTPLNPLTFGHTGNLFLRLRSWIDSDNMGIPDWWQLEYFGYVGINPNGDPAGDGYSNLYKYENGMNPFVAYPAVAPVFAVTPTANDSGSIISWSPSPGAVTSYTIYLNGSAIATVPNTQFTYVDNSTPVVLTDPDDSDYASYIVQANYAGNSVGSPAEPPLNPNWAVTPAIVRGAQGQYILILPDIPSGVTAIRLYVHPNGVEYPDYFLALITYAQTGGYLSADLVTNIIDVPVSAFATNGEYAIPPALLPPYGDYSASAMTCRALGPNGTAGLDISIWQANQGNFAETEVVAEIPFVDGTEQLRENLAFQLESADKSNPFSFMVASAAVPVAFQRQYAYAGFYSPLDPVYEYPFSYLSPFQPFEDNYFYRNFVYASTNLNDDGSLASGVYYDGGIQIPNATLYSFPEYDYVSTGNTNDLAPQMSATNAQWIYTGYEPGTSGRGNIGISESGTNLFLNSGQDNIFGLPYQSAKRLYASGSLYLNTLTSGGSSIPTVGSTEYFYGQVAPPQLQSDGYIFRVPNQDLLPGNTGFSPSSSALVTTQVILSVAQPFLISAWEKEELANGGVGKFGFLGQYFDKAYLADSYGNFNTNNPTGILSEYGDFLATQPGDTFLTTKLDGTNQGRLPVYVIALGVDANHDGTINPSLGDPDFTTAVHPMQFWRNSNSDRWHSVDFTDTEQDDLMLQNSPDYNYTVLGDRVIPCTRDLEDFARLWVCGVTPNLLASLQYGSSVILSWGDVGSPNRSNPTIDLFQAADADGGTGYLTSEATATGQTNITQCPYVGRLGPGGSIQLNSLANKLATTHFIWCGVSNGTGGLTLTIKDAHNNVLAKTTVYIQVQDIKQMYERWTVGDIPYQTPASVPSIAQDNLSPGEPTFHFASPVTTNIPYILNVHGWNMTTGAKDSFAESEFKRLYWQGYQGRFGEFRWPTLFNFPFEAFQWQSIDSKNFDASEFAAWNSGVGLLSLLTTLNAQYPGHVYLTAHSMGNVVAGEALRLAGASRVVNTYVAMQGAVSAHCYDPTTLNKGTFTPPDRYAYYYTNGAPSYFHGTAGAGTYVNFFNTNDYALAKWQTDEGVKPDLGYGYSFLTGYDTWYQGSLFSGTPLFFPTNTYTIFAYCDPAWSYALGAQKNVSGAFAGNQLELDIAPYNFGSSHKFHSREFRSDEEQLWNYWNEVLIDFQLKAP